VALAFEPQAGQAAIVAASSMVPSGLACAGATQLVEFIFMAVSGQSALQARTTA
jgi:hypothetical protein